MVLLILSVSMLSFVDSCSRSGIELKEGTLNIPLKKCADGKISRDKLSLCFDSVINDSRCPANAVCVWQGTAVAKFSLTKNDKSTSFELATIKMSPNYHKDTAIMGYKIEFVNLSPYPGTVPTPFPADQIKAELKITKE